MMATSLDVYRLLLVLDTLAHLYTQIKCPYSDSTHLIASFYKAKRLYTLCSEDRYAISVSQYLKLTPLITHIKY